jgi:serine/threonine protein kinase
MAERTRLGRYELIRPLGKGGMGEVFLAEQVGPKGFSKMVVVKRIRPELAKDPHFVKMFLEEAWIAASLTHPNIAQIFDLAQEGNEFWMAMEYVHGRTLENALHTVVSRGETIDPPIAAWLCAQVLRGLHYAHELRDVSGKPMHMVHRDLSPDNVLVTFTGGVKLVDFGIAKARGSLRAMGEVSGKWAYMAPEQRRGDPLDFRADLYSVGVLLHELGTGAPLEPGATELEDMTDSAARKWHPVRRGAGMPVFLREIARRALNADKSQRFGSAAEMAEALEGFVRGSGQLVDPPRIAKWMEELYGAEAARNTMSAPEDGPSGPATFSESKLKTQRAVSPVLKQRLQQVLTSQALDLAQVRVQRSNTLPDNQVPTTEPSPVPAPLLTSAGATAVGWSPPDATPSALPTPADVPAMGARPPMRPPTSDEVPVPHGPPALLDMRFNRLLWMVVAVAIAALGATFAVQTFRGKPLPVNPLQDPSTDPSAASTDNTSPVRLKPTPPTPQRKQ